MIDKPPCSDRHVGYFSNYPGPNSELNSHTSYVIKLGGATDADGVIALSVGSNVITVEVTAEDDSTTLTYTVAVTRAEPTTPVKVSSDASLSSLTIVKKVDFGNNTYRGRSFRTPANPSWVKRCLTRYTVPRATSTASATWGAGQPSSLLRRTRALAVTRAGCFPTRIRCWSSSRCSAANPTAYLSLTISATPANNTSHQAG